MALHVTLPTHKLKMLRRCSITSLICVYIMAKIEPLNLEHQASSISEQVTLLIGIADEQLNKAKFSGRNKVGF